MLAEGMRCFSILCFCNIFLPFVFTFWISSFRVCCCCFSKWVLSFVIGLGGWIFIYWNVLVCIFCLLIVALYGSGLIFWLSFPPFSFPLPFPLSFPSPLPPLTPRHFVDRIPSSRASSSAVQWSAVSLMDKGWHVYSSLAVYSFFLLSYHCHVFYLSDFLPEAMLPEAAISGPKFLPFSWCCTKQKSETYVHYFGILVL